MLARRLHIAAVACLPAFRDWGPVERRVPTLIFHGTKPAERTAIIKSVRPFGYENRENPPPTVAVDSCHTEFSFINNEL